MSSASSGNAAGWLDAWWEEQVRPPDQEEDPGIPAWYGTATGSPTPHPWSAVGGARERKPKVIDLNNLRLSFMKAYLKGLNAGTAQEDS